MTSVNGDRLLADLRALAEFGKVETGVHRLSLTPEDVAAREWLRDRMAEAGLSARIDGLGSVYGETPDARRTVLIGSHTDTVPKGGWLDGAMGVIYGLEIARAFLEQRDPGAEGTGVDVISFVDEEGHFHGTTGSLAFCNEFDLGENATLTNADGVTLTDALDNAGFAGAPIARVTPDRHACFLEAHIEQGPRLEDAGQRIGIVTSIVGMRRNRVAFTGQADHAGTTPMALRRDAAGAMVDFLARVRSAFRELAAENTVWNFGYVKVEPGAPNVVAAAAEVVVEYRDVDSALLDQMTGALRDAVDQTVADTDGRVEAAIEGGLAIPPADMSPDIGKVIEASSRTNGAEPLWMPSGAGHDAMILARHVPSAMLFIPSIGGRSHDVAEDTSEADIILGAQVLADTVDQLLAAEAAV